MADFDNDGKKDLHIANGYRRETGDRDFIDFIFPELKGNDNRSLRLHLSQYHGLFK